MTADRTPRALADLARPLRRLGYGAAAASGIGAALLAMAIAAWLVRLGAVRSPLWVVVTWLLALVAVVAAVVVAWGRSRRVGMRAVARTVEGAPGWRHGVLIGVLDGASAGTSAALFAAADQAAAAALDQRGTEALDPIRLRWRSSGRLGLVAVGLGVIALLGTRPLSGPVALLWSPAEAWATFVAPVQVTVDRNAVDRGESIALGLRAAGRRDAELWLRGKGEQWRRERVELDSTGRASRTIGPLEGDLFAFVASGGRSSDTVMVRVRLPVFLGRLTLTASYPAYLKLEDEVLPIAGDTLLLPEGTRLTAAGETTAELASAGWSQGSRSVAMRVEGTTFGGAITPTESGVLGLELITSDGAPLGGDPVRIPVLLVPDQVPQVEVPVPGRDTMPAMTGEVPLVIDVRDDYGVVGVSLHTRVHRNRQTAVVSLPLAGGVAERALLDTRLDLTGLGLVPGDTLSYWVEARDNAPRAQLGRSRNFVLIVPTRSETRQEQRSASQDIAKTLDSLVAESRALQRQTEDLSRERQRTSEGSRRGEQSLSFDEAKRAEQVARDQQDLIDQAEALGERLEQLQRSAEQGGITDSSFRRQLDEIRAQLDKAISPEMRQHLEQLRQALEKLDPQATKDALANLAEAQQKLREALERSKELFRRAALEGELSSLEQESREVREQQEAWNQKVASSDSAGAAASAAAEEQLAARTDSVAQGLEQAAKQLDSEERKSALESSAQQAKQAADKMREAAQSAQQGKAQEAKSKGEQAAQQMEQVEQQVQEQREEQQDAWRQEVVDALDRALAETARLSQRQLALSTAIGRGMPVSQTRQEQAVIEEGVQKIVEQVLAVSGKNALISPQIGTALLQARLQMARAREAVSSASANLREAAQQSGEAVDALNVAAFQMLRSRDDVSGSSSASGVAEAMQRMQQMAGQQGSLSQDGNNLLSMMMSQQQVGGQMQALAERQRKMAEELERFRAEMQTPGAQQLAEEARELARRLEAGRLDRETVGRQERLFRRMLDAGRTLQGEESDEKKERQGETARTDAVSIPAPLRRLQSGAGAVRLPSWEELQRLSPEERRLVTEYFRRLSAGSPP